MDEIKAPCKLFSSMTLKNSHSKSTTVFLNKNVQYTTLEVFLHPFLLFLSVLQNCYKPILKNTTPNVKNFKGLLLSLQNILLLFLNPFHARQNRTFCHGTLNLRMLYLIKKKKREKHLYILERKRVTGYIK